MHIAWTPADRKRIENRKTIAHPSAVLQNRPLKFEEFWERIEQVLNNLISNAIKYSRQGKRIEISGRTLPTEVVVSVTDQGPGIPLEEQPRVFERFYRGDKSRQRNGAGSGLGLAIAKSLTEAQGGSIRAESQLGEGTTILLQIPKSI
ncbi:MAG: ATP-binding protein [Pseudomonadota bacterium]